MELNTIYLHMPRLTCFLSCIVHVVGMSRVANILYKSLARTFNRYIFFKLLWKSKSGRKFRWSYFHLGHKAMPYRKTVTKSCRQTAAKQNLPRPNSCHKICTRVYVLYGLPQNVTVIFVINHTVKSSKYCFPSLANQGKLIAHYQVYCYTSNAHIFSLVIIFWPRF